MTVKARWLVTLAAVVGAAPVAEVLVRWFGPAYSASEARERTERMIEYVLGGGDQAGPAEAGESPPRRHELNPFYGYDGPAGLRLIESFLALDRRPDRDELFTVFVCGASVPAIFVGDRRGAADRLVELLEADPRIGGRSVEVCSLAREGYKQPQQLEKLVYLLARGARPDAVINIDGLNEVRTGARNPIYGIDPTWPSGGQWLHLTEGPAASPEILDAYIEARNARESLVASARASLDRDVYRSAILGLWHQREQRRRFDRWFALQATYVDRLADRTRPVSRKPEDRAAVLDVCVDTWRESSRLMHDICRERGIVYVHLMQPTLHDEGSKVVSEAERENGIGEEGLDPFIARAYDRLREAGAELAEDGVPCVDTTRIFADVEETVYTDRAHFGRTGNLILAERVAAELLARL